MATLQPLSADVLASELSKLPLLNAATASTLNAVRIAIARAVASGQSADELSTALGLPASWQGIDLSKPPAVALGSAETMPLPWLLRSCNRHRSRSLRPRLQIGSPRSFLLLWPRKR